MTLKDNITRFINKIPSQWDRLLWRYASKRSFRKKIEHERSKTYIVGDRFSKPAKTRPMRGSSLQGFVRLYRFVEHIQPPSGFLLSWLGVFLLVLCGYIFFFSPYFQISPSKVIIERQDTFSDVTIAYKSLEDIYGENIFLINTSTIVDRVTKLEKNIKSVQVRRLFPSGLLIQIASYVPVFNVHMGDMLKNYVITSNGILLSLKNRLEDLPLLDINDPALIERGLFDFREGIRADYMKNILDFVTMFVKFYPSQKVAKYSFFRTEREIHVALESGTILIFSLQDPLNAQFSLVKFYNDSNKNILGTGNLVYLDARIAGKLYVCDDKKLCKKNLSNIYVDVYK